MRQLAQALMVGCTLAVTVHAQGTATEAVRHFEENVARYVALRNAVAADAPKLTVTSDPRVLDERVRELAARIRAARRDARQGDVFSPDVSDSFRALIRTSMRRHAATPADLRANINDDAQRVPRRQLAVNARFSWNIGSEVPEEVLEVLPRLPDILEYKFVDTDLLLVDLQADLIVDVVRNVVAAQ